jgi:hypothetical protein
VKTDDRLALGDHYFNAAGVPVPVPEDLIGQTVGTNFLTQTVVRPLGIEQIIRIAQAYAMKIQEQRNEQAKEAAAGHGSGNGAAGS